MKSIGIGWTALAVLILCGAAFSQTQLHGSIIGYKTNSVLTRKNALIAVTAKNAIHIQSQPVIEPLTPGGIVAGSIPAPAVANDCLLGITQYRIEFPGGVRKLVIGLEGDQDVNLYVRRDSLITFEEGKILADFKSDSPQRNERLSLPAIVQGSDHFITGVPLLESGTYFIAVTNCGPGAAGYTLRAQILDPPDAERVNLTVNGVEVGSVPAPDPGFCRVGRTQYAAFASFDPCGSAFVWGVDIRADQNVNVYVRKDKPVTVENGIVVYDRVTESQAKIQHVGISQDTPGAALYFVAVENCSLEAVNYTLASEAAIGDYFPPFISTAFFEKKDLHVIGPFFTEKGVVLIDGQPQETIYGGTTEYYEDILIIKKAKKKTARHQMVVITVRRGVCTSPPFMFIRP